MEIFSKNPQILGIVEIRPEGAKLFHADSGHRHRHTQADMAKLTDAFEILLTCLRSSLKKKYIKTNFCVYFMHQHVVFPAKTQASNTHSWLTLPDTKFVLLHVPPAFREDEHTTGHHTSTNTTRIPLNKIREADGMSERKYKNIRNIQTPQFSLAHTK